MNALRFALIDAWRLLRARPLANLAVVFVLACGLAGVGSIAAIVETVSGVAPDATRSEGFYGLGAGQGSAGSLSLPGEEALALRRDVAGLANAVLLRWNDFNIASEGAGDDSRAERASGLLVDGDPFAALGWPMALGRGFTAADFAADAAPVVVIGDRLWRSRFAADPAVLGAIIRLDGEPATVVGVLPPRRAYPFQQQVYRAVHLPTLSEHWPRPWQVVLRVDDPARFGPIAAALAELQRERESRLGNAARENPLRIAPVFGDTGSSDPATQMVTLALMVVAGLVMVMAASNAGGLLLVQWLGRGRDLATRHALGATSGRVLGSLLMQGAILAAVGWLLSLLASQWALDALNQYLWTHDNGQPLYIVMKLSPKVLAVAGAVALLTVGVLTLPTWRRLRRGDLAQDLRSGARTAGGSLSRFGRVLFGLQILLAVVTVLVTLQAVEGARMQLQRGLGLDTGSVIVAQFNSSKPVEKGVFAQRLREALAAEPGIAAVTVSGSIPVGLTSNRDVANGEVATNADYAPVDLGYRDVYGFGLRSGRWFTAEEINQQRKVAVIDPAFAAALFGADDPVGRRFALHDSGGEIEHVVVGVSESVRLGGVGGPDRPSLFVPVAKAPVYELAMSARVRGDVGAQAGRVAEIARTIDPDFALTDLGSFADLRWRANAWTRMVLGLFAPLGGIALLLAAAGLAALLGSLVTQRVREIGVRRALGASTGNVVRVLTGGLALWAGVGAMLGIALALQLARPLSQSLYDESSIGSFSVLGTLAVMLAALACAAAVPLRRALRIAPTEALREE